METIFGLIVTIVCFLGILGLSNLYGRSNNKILDTVIQLAAGAVAIDIVAKYWTKK